MNFDVRFFDPIDIDVKSETAYSKGMLWIPHILKEPFWPSLYQMSKRDYMRQWVTAVEMLESGRDRSALILSFADDGDCEIVGNWRPLYLKENNIVVMQEGILHRELVSEGFSVDNFAKYIDDYARLWEQYIALADLISFKSDVLRRLDEYPSARKRQTCSFDVQFTDSLDPLRTSDIEHAEGVLQIGDSLHETFISYLYDLSKRDYMRQWVSAIEMIEDGKDRSAIITDYFDGRIGAIGVWWPLYRLGNNQIAIHNEMICDRCPEEEEDDEQEEKKEEENEEPFDFERFEQHVKPYEQVMKDGLPRLEWRTTVDELVRLKHDILKRLSE